MLIKGRLVTLRAANLTDREKIFQWCTNSDITASMMGSPNFPDCPIPSRAEFWADYTDSFFQDDGNSSGRCFVILQGNEEVGAINYDGLSRQYSCAELDIWLAAERFCGHGYGSDALITLTNYLFEQYGISYFVLRPSARNQRAIAAYQKAGFTIVKALDFLSPCLQGEGDCYDTVIMFKNMKKI